MKLKSNFELFERATNSTNSKLETWKKWLEIFEIFELFEFASSHVCGEFDAPLVGVRTIFKSIPNTVAVCLKANTSSW